ncbi:hypothetical protein [Parapedobacter sp. 2B3]|uniref:hypothetical protein n=1 Tax=Parapedobacter sp. 2B3 TaxID=3342381 RepID=UPI0035B62690
MSRIKQSHFTDKTAYWAVISIIGGLLLWNLYATVTTGRLVGLLPITIQSILLGLIFMKHQYARIGIKIWAIVFLAIASGLQFFGRLLEDAVNGFPDVDWQHYLTKLVTGLIGIVLVICVNRTVQVVECRRNEIE